jgi:hypothetical protein
MPAKNTYAASKAQFGGVGPFMVKLLYAAPPSLKADALLPALRQVAGKVDLVSSDPNMIMFGLPDAGATLPDGKRAPYMVSVLPAEVGDLGPSLHQSWDWPLARDFVSKTRHAVVVSDMMTMGLDRKPRVEAYDQFLRIVLRAAPPAAMHWLASERVVEPSAYLATTDSEERLAKGYVNVRLFRVEGRNPGECIMDTLGMASFGLPDLQCHFVALDPGRVAAVLFNFAGYVFDKGDVLRDGNTIEGVVPGVKWRCRHEMSLAPPERVVVDFHPGPARPPT